MHKVIETLLFRLLERELISLEEGSTIGELIDEVVIAMRNNQKLIQLGSWFGETLLKSKHVEELYATDQELNTILKDLQL